MGESGINRQKNFELYRVLLMFFIVVGHYYIHGVNRSNMFSEFFLGDFVSLWGWIISQILLVVGCSSVNGFILLSGFFLIDRYSFRWKGLLDIWLKTVFYCLCFSLLRIIILRYFLNLDISIKELFYSLAPMLNRKYWFITNYCGLLLVAPFISTLVKNLSVQQYRLLIIWGGIMCCQYTYGDLFAGSNSLAWFVFLFLVGGYIRMHNLPSIVSNNRYKFVICSLAIVLLTTCIINIRDFYPSNHSFHLIILRHDSTLFLLSLSVFCMFINFDVVNSKFLTLISKLSPYTLGVYLIHDNIDLKNLGFWKRIIPDEYSIPMALHCLLSCVILFVACCMVDAIREKLFSLLKVDTLAKKIAKKLPSSL